MIFPGISLSTKHRNIHSQTYFVRILIFNPSTKRSQNVMSEKVIPGNNIPMNEKSIRLPNAPYTTKAWFGIVVIF